MEKTTGALGQLLPSLPARSFFQGSFGDAESCLDEYFEFVRNRIRYHWEGNKKSNPYAFGVDIKYKQLTRRGETGISEATVRSPQKIAAGQGSRIGNR